MNEDIIFDFSRLRGRIVEIFSSQRNFSKYINMSESMISARLNNDIEMTNKEIIQWANALEIEITEIPRYFFTEKVQKGEQRGGEITCQQMN